MWRNGGIGYRTVVRNYATSSSLCQNSALQRLSGGSIVPRTITTQAPTPLDKYSPSDIEKSLGSSIATEPAVKQSLRHQKSSKVFTMVIPPPNVTGQLHLGHALTVSIQDSLARWRRMCGDDVVWVPGLDHAGIATQSVVEKRLMRDSKLTRYDLGREKFVATAMEWHDEFSSKIVTQLHRIGASLDWDRYVYTLDERRSSAVRQSFVTLHDKGLVYRKPRLINWCPHLRTVISDLEVEHVELEKATELKLPGGHKVTLGVMDSFAYPVAATSESGDEPEYLVVSTTRLETMLGDEAVVVHPDDERYKHLHGRKVIHPIHGKEIPILCDNQLVDMEFGTGVVKITPAHDPNDYLCAERHNIPNNVCIFDDDATLNENCGSKEFVGLGRFEAREKLRSKLAELNLYHGSSDHAMSIAICSRSGDVIEPMLKEQWYVDCQTMGKRALQLANEGSIQFLPQHHQTDWNRWLENIQDWCVSRQLWWGHRIPAYRVTSPLLSGSHEELWVVANTQEEAELKALQKLASIVQLSEDEVKSKGSIELHQDEDVLDTWFSSSLFPLTALGWPTGTGQHGFDPGMDKHYPLTLLETGSDILFFWVARMVMICSEVCPPKLAGNSNISPFENVVLHPMVRDKDGRKMSKSLGNVIDPLHVIDGVSLEELLEPLSTGNLDPREVKLASKQLKKQFPEGIPNYGTDALRLGLISYLQQGRQINLDLSRVEYWAYFCNKVWNAQKFMDIRFERHCHARFGDDVDESRFVALTNMEPDNLKHDLPRRWILHRLWETTKAYDEAMKQYELFEALDKVERFFIDDFCGIFLEAAKRHSVSDDEMEQQYIAQTLAFGMDCTLRLLHPFAPFITEYLWKRWTVSSLDSVGLSVFPEPKHLNCFQDFAALDEMDAVNQVSYGLRSLRPLAAKLTDVSKVEARVVVSPEASTVHSTACVQFADVIKHTSWMPHLEVVNQAEGDVDNDKSAKSQSSLTKLVLGGTVTVSIPIHVNDNETRAKVEKELAGLRARSNKLLKAVEKVKGKLANEKFIENAPAHVIEKENAGLAKSTASYEAIKCDIEGLEAILAARAM